jgi:hypothetical protein
MADATQVGLEATSAAVSAAALLLTGIDHHTLLYATAGASLGMLSSPRLGLFRYLSVLASVALVCAAIGYMVAFHWFKDDLHYRWGFASILAALFFPLLNAISSRVPGLLDVVLPARKDGQKQ